MRRTTVMLPEDLKNRAEAHARARGISFGSQVRRSLERTLAEPRGEAPDPFFDDAAVWGGAAPADLAVEHDRHLYEDDSPGTEPGA